MAHKIASVVKKAVGGKRDYSINNNNYPAVWNSSRPPPKSLGRQRSLLILNYAKLEIQRRKVRARWKRPTQSVVLKNLKNSARLHPASLYRIVSAYTSRRMLSLFNEEMVVLMTLKERNLGVGGVTFSNHERLICGVNVHDLG